MMAATELAKAKVPLITTHLSITPPGRANPASPRAAEIARVFAGGGMLEEKKELETLRSDADDSPSEPDDKPLHLELQVSNSSLYSSHSASPRVPRSSATCADAARACHIRRY